MKNVWYNKNIINKIECCSVDNLQSLWHCCKVSDEAAFCLIQRPYISKTLLTRRISPRGSP
ncbi:hypothetical protein D0685_24995 [Shigella sonnei]|nr:hypothetical protein [Shigella sonnei]EFX7399498.1 hypothetical protein [Shigella sonnei]EFY1016515.1 hypothetical protein [Shigella sonnei]EFY1666639.1 hypothetical protein [Shigella sonnei]